MSRRLNTLAWSEGMFLRPHHLQHSDAFAEARLNHHLRSIDPFHWGVREFVLDDEALSDHRIVVQRLEAVLPSGAILRYPSGNARVQSREFDPELQKLSVYVGLPNLRHADPNSAETDEDVRDVRYLVHSDDLPDVNRGGFEAAVELCDLNVRLIFSGEDDDLELHETFKLAEVVATGDLKRPFRLSEAYAPPLLAIQGCPFLADEVGQIVSQIAAKVRVVAGRTETVMDQKRLFMRYTLARMTPVLRHLLSTGETRPFQLYTALIETAGALGALRRMEALDLPLYRHDDLYGCFHALIEFIDTELEAVEPDRFKMIPLPFNAEKRHYATSDLNTQTADQRNVFFLGIKPPTNLEVEELVSLIHDHAKTSSVTGVKQLEMLNRAGLKIEHLPGAPTEISAEAGYEYFRIDAHGPQWKKVMDEYTFAIAVGKMENAEVRLYVVMPEE